MEQIMPAGTVVHYHGFPFELVEDTKVESATNVRTAQAAGLIRSHLTKMDSTQSTALRVECKRLRPDAIIPTRAKDTDAGYDLYAPESFDVPVGGITQVATGIALTVPAGYYYTIEGRSRFWKYNTMPHTGIIDATYSGELLVTMVNNSDHLVFVAAGERFAQIVVQRMVETEIVEVDEISYTGRGAAGFGSSGK